MEDAHRHVNDVVYAVAFMSLNPCSDGSCSPRITTNFLNMKESQS